ncbi:MAG: hypothetical protein WBF81_01435, partial [Thermoplasmata archaeon]
MPANPTASPDIPVAEPVVRPIRLKKGQQPTHSTLNGFQQWAWRTFRARVLAKPPDPVLEENLVKAHMRIRPDEFMATVYATTVVVTVVLLIAGAVVGFLFISSGSFLFGVLIAVGLPVLGAVGTFFALQGSPGSRAKTRGRNIDRRISPAMSFVSAMASADVNVDQIFKELGRQKIYGEVAEEAAWVTRDT